MFRNDSESGSLLAKKTKHTEKRKKTTEKQKNTKYQNVS